MIWFPPAKINLGLQVLKKREDGYHDIRSCFYPTGWTDILEIISSSEFSFTTSGLSIPGPDEENLCFKAYHLLKKDYDLPAVKIHLHKIIPMGAGLGGGSSDAAFTLRGLNEIFDLNLPVQQLHQYASRLGSDCAFFVHNVPMLAKGRGDILDAVDISLKEYKLAIIYPEIHINTTTAYSGIKPDEHQEPLEEILQLPVQYWKDHLMNDFETNIFSRFPEIRKIKNKLYDLNAVYASMSGSGSAVYGLFKFIPDDLQTEFPDYIIYTD